MYTCRICHKSHNNSVHQAREMMFGFRDRFHYLECARCGCLQLIDPPADIARYYPAQYYSYSSVNEKQLIRRSIQKQVKRILKKQVLNAYLKGRPMPDRVVSKFRKEYPWLKPRQAFLTSRVLDVGCGSGNLLLQMKNDGFKDLTGLDPFIENDIHYGCGITIHKKELKDLEETFDFIMMHHAFEHMDSQQEVLREVHRLLAPNGLLLVRIPVADSLAWKEYGTDWVQLDAPRHFFVHTRKSMQHLASECGFRIESVVNDSWELQFYGSELYRRDIPLTTNAEHFTEGEIKEFKQESQRLNMAGAGDQACFYLRKSS